MEKVVGSNGHVEKISWCDSGRVAIGICGAGRGNYHARGAVVAVTGGDGTVHGRALRTAEKANGRLLRGGQPQYIVQGLHCSGNRAAVITPSECHPRPVLSVLVT